LAEQGTTLLAKAVKSKFFYGYIVVVSAALTSLVMTGTINSFGVFFKPLLSEFGWTRAATAGAFFTHSVVHGLVLIAAGRLCDRFGPRLLLTVSAFFLGLGFFLMSQVQAMWQLYLFYGVLLAVGKSGSYVPMASTVARWFAKRRGLMMGIVLATSSLGETIIPPIAGRLIATYAWRNSYAIIALIALVPTALAAQFLRRDPAQMNQLPYGAKEVKTGDVAPATEGLSLREATRTREFWLISVIAATSAFGVGTIIVHIVAHASDIGMSATSAANVMAVVGGLAVVGRIVVGIATDRIGSKMGLIIICILEGLPLFLLAGAKEPWMIYVLAGIFGFSYGGFPSLHPLVFAELFGVRSLGVILGLSILAVSLGIGIGSFLTGRIYDTTGSYSLAFLISGAVMVIGLIAAFIIKSPRKQGGANDS
jgi:MFS family permease